jgi:hypothetical protein
MIKFLKYWFWDEDTAENFKNFGGALFVISAISVFVRLNWLGGTAVAGKVEARHYFLKVIRHQRFIEVTPAQYRTSYVIELLGFVGIALMVIGGVISQQKKKRQPFNEGFK